MNPGVWRGVHSLQKDEQVLKHKVAPGTIPRVLRLGRPYAGILSFFLGLVVELALAAGGVSLVDSALTFWQRQIASRVGREIVFDLRTKVFVHIQRMSLAFFTRARTGALVSRLNSDVSGVRDAFLPKEAGKRGYREAYGLRAFVGRYGPRLGTGGSFTTRTLP
jgi:ATP-binding cassette subfamily B protein